MRHCIDRLLRPLLGKLLMSFALGGAAALGFIACGGGTSAVVQAVSFMAAALVSQQAHQPGYNDFLRLIYDNINPPPTKLGGPNAYRVFFAPTAFYQPPITLSQIADFSGIPVKPAVSLFAMRCQPSPGSTAAPQLATWPNLIAAALTDYKAKPPTPNTMDAAILTLAQSFTDITSTVATEPLYNALAVGKQFFEAYPFDSPTPYFTADQMQGQASLRFGTFPAFSGLGYAVEGTGTGPALDAVQTTQQMMVPEYILRNVTLTEAGCTCIQVPPYNGRDDEKLDPDYISKVGGPGACVQVSTLGPQ